MLQIDERRRATMKEGIKKKKKDVLLDTTIQPQYFYQSRAPHCKDGWRTKMAMFAILQTCESGMD